MKKKPFSAAKLLAAGVAAAIAFSAAVDAWAEKAGPANADEKLPLQEIRRFSDIFGAIKNFYVDPVGDKKLLEQALSGMVSGLDPHSAYLDAEAFKDLQEGTEGEFGGLGIEVTKDGKNGVQVVTPIDDTPAAKAGVLAGDLIIKIDDTFTYDLSLSKCVKMMRGKPRTGITLQIARKGEKKPVIVKIVRDIIKVQSVKSKSLPNGIGYIRISQFQERTAEDLAKALSALQKRGAMKGLVLDLRNNPGGLLDAAVNVSGLFLDKDRLVVSTKGRTPDSKREFHTGQALPRSRVSARAPESAKTVPIAVLINSSSASASEIVAGALQDHKRATIMGRRSFGKGSVQTVIPLSASSPSERSALKLTTARYYTPSGRSIQATGITPDIAVDDTPDGNFPSFSLREADLNNHLTTSSLDEEQEEEFDDTAPADSPSMKKIYRFGEKDDFPLQQAVNFLTDKPVAKTRAAMAAEKAKRSAAGSDTITAQPEAKNSLKPVTKDAPNPGANEAPKPTGESK